LPKAGPRPNVTESRPRLRLPTLKAARYRTIARQERTADCLPPNFRRTGIVIALTSLSPESREQASALRNSNTSEIARIQTPNLSKRHAAWHRDTLNAQREAKKLGLATLFAFSGTSWCPPCQAMDKKVFRTAQFQIYANQNLVIRLIDIP